ncbi:DMT family transporter [Roseovarius sp. LXJ103]|nr:DMT family transporter [Roseovarius carneus]PWE36984.1 EamA/RhaT family transporter [Pelagicola sp. LXJ1103]
MKRGSAFGLGLATFGAVVLTPDALLMRLSGMDGAAMMGWRGLVMGSVLVALWALTSSDRGADLAALRSRTGMVVTLCHSVNAALFCIGIAIAPVAIVLLGVATVPVFSALFGLALMGERTGRATWITIAAVSVGIVLAVTGGHETGALSAATVFGTLAGLGVAAALALNFTMLRAQTHLPILLLIGVGAWIAGAAGWAVQGPAAMWDGEVWAMLLTGSVVLPLSFFALSLAARHTPAANVSLLLLLETVLGPFWVWLALGEPITAAMLAGGAIVVGSLAIYLLRTRRRTAPTD